MEKQKFEFPDEKEVKKEEPQDELQIEVVDDTPEEDRGKTPMPKELVNELEQDDLEEYSEKVKKRMSQMKKVWHDERREKEAALRAREEAIRFAQIKDNEIKNLRQMYGAGEKILVNEVMRSASFEINTAKEKLKQAYESGDAEQIANAQEALTDAKIKLKEAELYRPTLQPVENNVQVAPQPRPAPQPVDQKAEGWRQRNDWFGTDTEMTASALGLHEKLVRSGIDPRSDDYYQRIDATMRKRFPEYEWDDADPQTRQSESETKNSERAPRKPANVVAPVTRSAAPKQIRLTATQVALAKKLGLTNEAYAKELMKLENRNG